MKRSAASNPVNCTVIGIPNPRKALFSSVGPLLHCLKYDTFELPTVYVMSSDIDIRIIMVRLSILRWLVLVHKYITLVRPSSGNTCASPVQRCARLSVNRYVVTIYLGIHVLERALMLQ